MGDKKRKPYIVVTLSEGEKEIWSLSREAAYKAALARGWLPVEVYEKSQREVKKAA